LQDEIHGIINKALEVKEWKDYIEFN
jgi:hypothetical protein